VRDLLAALGEPLAAAPAAMAPAAPIAAATPPPVPPVGAAAPGARAGAAAPVWRPRLAAFLRRLEPLHGGLGLVGLMVGFAALAALLARCGGGGR
jgi:hypothetical protein